MYLPGGTGKKAKQFEGTSANSIKVSLSDLDAVRMVEIFRILLLFLLILSYFLDSLQKI